MKTKVDSHTNLPHDTNCRNCCLTKRVNRSFTPQRPKHTLTHTHRREKKEWSDKQCARPLSPSFCHNQRAQILHTSFFHPSLFASSFHTLSPSPLLLSFRSFLPQQTSASTPHQRKTDKENEPLASNCLNMRTTRPQSLSKFCFSPPPPLRTDCLQATAINRSKVKIFAQVDSNIEI